MTKQKKWCDLNNQPHTKFQKYKIYLVKYCLPNNIKELDLPT